MAICPHDIRHLPRHPGRAPGSMNTPLDERCATSGHALVMDRRLGCAAQDDS
jgi:hypothetical protein